MPAAAPHPAASSGAAAGAAEDEALAFLIFEPSAESVRDYLQPIRDLEVLPTEAPFGAAIRGCYELRDSAEATAALARAGFTATPYTVVFPVFAPSWRKLALLYRLTAAGVTDPSELPCEGAAACLAAATCPPAAVEHAAAAPPARAAFLQRLFCVLARHKGGIPGSFYAGAVPHSVFDALEAKLRVTE